MRRFIALSLCFLFLASSCSVVRNSNELQRLVNHGTARTITIKNDIDLHGALLSFPKGSTLNFKSGVIQNGHLKFNATKLKGNVRFEKCSYEGTIVVRSLDDRRFTSADDGGTLKFLLANAIANGARCIFNRDYRIDMKAASGAGFLAFRNIKSGADISFQGHTIYNTTKIPTPGIRPVLVFTDVKNVTIRDVLFHDTDEHNTHLFKNSSGCTFVQCYGDCESINLLNCSQENGDCILRSGVYVHDKKHPEYTPHRGLTNSTLKVKSNNAGYGLALYCGENLDIEIDVSNPHRGFYCAGVSNSRIRYKGYNPLETKCHILVKDAVYLRKDRNGKEVLDMKGCHDLDIQANVDELLKTEIVLTFQSYGSGKRESADFTFRSGKCHHYNIDFTAAIKKYPENGYFLICNCASDSGALGDDDMYGCKISNALIHDVRITGPAKKYICLVASSVDADITVKDCDVDEASAGRNNGYAVRVNGLAKGKMRIINGVVDNIIVDGKDGDSFDVEMDNTRFLNGVNYQNMQAPKRSLLRVKQ